MRPWTGTWVTDRLGPALHTHATPAGVPLPSLVGLAVRRNPRRAHLLVSTVLGKHVPTDPRLVHASGLLLGRLVADALAGPGSRSPDEEAGVLLADALAGQAGAAAGLRDLLQQRPGRVRALVLGYAETATALGHSVADALGESVYLHSTRRAVAGVPAYGGFEEEHSHATSHLLLPVPGDLLDADLPLVLVDDELSTGRTVRNTLRALHAVRPRAHYVVAALIDLRGPQDRAAMDALAAELDVRIDVVALASGGITLPEDVLARGTALVAEVEAAVRDPAPAPARGAVVRIETGWPEGVPAGGRHGFTPAQREILDKELPGIAARVAAGLPPDARRVLVLGFEELMYAPLRIAEALADLLDGVEVRYSTTTRSPVLAVDDPGYAIRNRLVFPAHDDPADGPGERYAYNVRDGFDAVVFTVDAEGDTAELEEGLLRRLSECGEVVVATVREEIR